MSAEPGPEVRTPDSRLVVALDATPLIGRATGVGVFCREALGALSHREEIAVRAFAVSWRQRHAIESGLTAGVTGGNRAMPARPLHFAWRHGGLPPIEWFIGRVDVVHGTNFVVPPARRAVRVMTVHDLTVIRYPKLCTRDTLRYPALIRRALKGGAWIHTPSASVAAEVVEVLGADPERVRAVHSGVPALPAVAELPEGAPPPVHLPDGCHRYILSVATAEPRKDLPGLVEAFGHLAEERPDTALVLAGPDGWGTDALDRSLETSAFARRVVRPGWVDDLALARLIKGAAVLAYPSVYEGFGFPPLQAMAAGVPVVATRAGALPEVLGDGADLVPVGDPVALASALARVLDDAGHASDLVRRGQARATTFSWDACAAGLAELYGDAMTSQQS